jgi:two-component system response regulator AtoC
LTENKIEKIRLLVVSREPSVLRLLWSIEESNSWHLETAASGWDAMEQVQSGVAPHLLLLDIPRGDADSLHLLRWLRRLRPELPVVVLCCADDAANGKEASRLGAEQILMRPFDERQLEAAIRRHVGVAGNPAGNDEADIISENVEQLGQGSCFVSASPIMQKLRAQAALLAQIDVPVLILGESGAGKYTVASLIHKLSVRSGFRLLVVNCAEMPEALLEAELFGDEDDVSATVRGSNLGRTNLGRTNLERNSIGKFAAGEKGAIFLDEIAAMPLSLQSRLLQVLQHNESRRPDGTEAIPGQVRILAASSDNLERALAEKRFREDLYYRLSGFTVHVPPMRQRKDEIPTLLRYFMHKLAKRYNLPPRGFSPAVLDACQRYAWPGNLKELETFVKRLLVAGEQDLNLGGMVIESARVAESAPFPQVVRMAAALPEEREAGQKQGEPESLKSLIQGIKSEAEQNAIGAALKQTGWNRKAAARLLRVSYRTLLYKIEQYQMRAPEPFLSPLPAGEFSLFGSEVKSNGK